MIYADKKCSLQFMLEHSESEVDHLGQIKPVVYGVGGGNGSQKHLG